MRSACDGDREGDDWDCDLGGEGVVVVGADHMELLSQSGTRLFTMFFDLFRDLR